MNRDLAILERSQLLLIIVNQDDLVAHVRKTRPGHESHIS
jgi:hypothetical protein